MRFDRFGGFVAWIYRTGNRTSNTVHRTPVHYQRPSLLVHTSDACTDAYHGAYPDGYHGAYPDAFHLVHTLVHTLCLKLHCLDFDAEFDVDVDVDFDFGFSYFDGGVDVDFDFDADFEFDVDFDFDVHLVLINFH